MCDLQRSGASMNLQSHSELSFDFLLWRHMPELRDSLRAFRPDLLHVTGPCDIGILGAWMAHELQIPLVASWHTNVHEYAGRRLRVPLRAYPLPPNEAPWSGPRTFMDLLPAVRAQSGPCRSAQ